MDLSSAVKNLIYIDPFWGHIALGLQKEFNNDLVPTACAAIVGMDIKLYFNENFWNTLTDKQRVGLVQHELGHVCLFHLIHMGDYPDKELFNIAADMTINQYIDPDYLPGKCILPNSFEPEIVLEKFKDTNYYYTELEKQKQKSPKLQNLLSALKVGKPTICSHPLWGKGADGKEISDAMKELVKNQIEHQIKEVFENSLNKNPGNVPGYLRDFIHNLYIKNPPVLDWKAVIRQFKAFCDKQIIKFTKNRPNKRYPEFEAVTLRQQRKMIVGVDTSGSISNDMLQQFFDQISHMSKTGVEIDVIEWDYGIQRIYEFNSMQKWKNGEVKGGGGTNPFEVVEKLNKTANYHAMIMFTDGYIAGEWLKASKPILWVITKDGTKDFKFPGNKIIIQK